MFEALSERLAAALKRISGRGVLRPEDVDAGLREVRFAPAPAAKFGGKRSDNLISRQRNVGRSGDNDQGRA